MLLKIMDETHREITLEELLNEENVEDKINDTSYESSGKKIQSINKDPSRMKTHLQKENSVPECKSMIKNKLFGVSKEESQKLEDEQQAPMKVKKNRNRKRRNKNKNKKKKDNPIKLLRSNTEVVKGNKEQDLRILDSSLQKDFSIALPEPSCEEGWTAVPEPIKKKKSKRRRNQQSKSKTDSVSPKKSNKASNSQNTSFQNNLKKESPPPSHKKKESDIKENRRKKPNKNMADRISKSIMLQLINLSVEKSLDKVNTKEASKVPECLKRPVKVMDLSNSLSLKCKEEKEIKLITENEDSESCSSSVIRNKKSYESTVNSERSSPSASTCIKLKKEDISLISNGKESDFDQISQPYVEERKEKRFDKLMASSEEKKYT